MTIRREGEDIVKGLRSYSNDLVLEADRELADVEPSAKGLLYEFVGEPSEMTEEDLHLLLKINDTQEEKLKPVTDFLLYLGFLGVKVGHDDPRFIYNVGYDLGILRAIQKKNSERSVFVLNPAFWPALEIRVV